jgi:hypothetical protein
MIERCVLTQHDYRRYERTYIALTASGMSRHQRNSTINRIEKLGWRTEFVRPEESNIRVIDRVVSKPSYMADGTTQNQSVHYWGVLKDLGLEVEYSNSNGTRLEPSQKTTEQQQEHENA